MGRAEFDRVFYQCECGMRWKSELARDLCIGRKHAPLKVYEAPAEPEPAPVVIEKKPQIKIKREVTIKAPVKPRWEVKRVDEQLTCCQCGAVFVRPGGMKGKKPKRCENCRKRNKPSGVLRCVDCGVKINKLHHIGPNPKRCFDCREKKQKDVMRRYYESRKLREKNDGTP